MFKFILLQILLFATFKVQSLEIIETSESVQFEQGTSDFLFCQADDSVDFCSWTKDGAKCLASQGQEVPCDELSNARVNLEDGKCGLHLEGLTRAEVGTYACTLILGQDNVQGEVNVDVLVPASLEFHDEFAFPGQVEVELDATVTVTCTAKGGYPAPELTASVIDSEGNIVRDLIEVEDLAKTIMNENDGTQDVEKHFALIPHLEDCGRSVQCSAHQGDGTFAINEFRELKVFFAPLPIDDDRIFEYREEDQTVVSVIFMASPAPADNQVIWHHNPSQAEDIPPPPGSLSLQAGFTSNDGRYDAMPIEVNGHEITATLNINSPADDLQDGVFYVEVFNDHGSQKYHFTFQEYMEETTDPIDTFDEEPVETMSGGTIAAILVVILAILAGIGVTWYAKKNDKWCFANSKPDYNVTATNEPDPIIKNQETKVNIEKQEETENVTA